MSTHKQTKMGGGRGIWWMSAVYIRLGQSWSGEEKGEIVGCHSSSHNYSALLRTGHKPIDPKDGHHTISHNSAQLWGKLWMLSTTPYINIMKYHRCLSSQHKVMTLLGGSWSKLRQCEEKCPWWQLAYPFEISKDRQLVKVNIIQVFAQLQS